MTNSWFEEKRSHYQFQGDLLKNKSAQLSLARVLSFALFIVVAITAIYFRNMYLLLLGGLGFLVLFGLLVKYHNKLIRKKRHFDILANLNKDELKRLELDLTGLSEGEDFKDTTHAYSHDLDLFGQHSLFQWLNRTVTPDGGKLLAQVMQEKASKEIILERQQAVEELKNEPDWLQHFLAGGMAHQDPAGDVTLLLKWLKQKDLPTIPFWYKWALIFLPVISVGLTIAYFSGQIPFVYLLPMLIINGLILNSAQPQAKNTFTNTQSSIRILLAYGSMIEAIEDATFKSALLNQLQGPFLDKSYRASKAIRQLKGILERIETRQNFFYWTFNILLLMDLIWLIQAAAWKAKYSTYVSQWFEAISEYEVISSLAMSRFAHPDWTVPEISEDPFCFNGEDLGHPLLPPVERVKNSFRLTNEGTVAVLTGSNMSGKSTFLRTIGVNAVLGLMGGACCAKNLKLGEFQVFTSMRTTDSLKQHVSSFYAELQRLNQLISSLGKGNPTLFLLDEILKGTNSADRHLGATALIKQLHEADAFGLVSTHDLALGKLAEQNSGIHNFSFNSQLIAGKLVFDYQLSEGVCDSFNASELMAQMGIAMEKAQD